MATKPSGNAGVGAFGTFEDTPRERLIEAVAGRIRDGLGYQPLLAALMLAGVRGIQPRPVGFKFHAVLVVNSAHLASLAAAVNALKMAFGIDLTLPGAMVKLSAMLALAAKLQVPSLSLNLPALNAMLSLSAGLATIKAALGIDLTLPGAGAQLSAMLAPLLSLSLQLPSLPPLPSLSLLATMNLQALLGLNLPALPSTTRFISSSSVLVTLIFSPSNGTMTE